MKVTLFLPLLLAVVSSNDKTIRRRRLPVIDVEKASVLQEEAALWGRVMDVVAIVDEQAAVADEESVIWGRMLHDVSMSVSYGKAGKASKASKEGKASKASKKGKASKSSKGSKKGSKDSKKDSKNGKAGGKSEAKGSKMDAPAPKAVMGENDASAPKAFKTPKGDRRRLAIPSVSDEAALFDEEAVMWGRMLHDESMSMSHSKSGKAESKSGKAESKSGKAESKSGKAEGKAEGKASKAGKKASKGSKSKGKGTAKGEVDVPAMKAPPAVKGVKKGDKDGRRRIRQ